MIFLQNRMPSVAYDALWKIESMQLYLNFAIHCGQFFSKNKENVRDEDECQNEDGFVW